MAKGGKREGSGRPKGSINRKYELDNRLKNLLSTFEDIITGKYYVYAHFDEKTDTCLYIGKGSNGRAWTKERNVYWKKYTKENDYYVRIIANGLNEQEALDIETYLINTRKPLLNIDN